GRVSARVWERLGGGRRSREVWQPAPPPPQRGNSSGVPPPRRAASPRQRVIALGGSDRLQFRCERARWRGPECPQPDGPRRRVQPSTTASLCRDSSASDACGETRLLAATRCTSISHLRPLTGYSRLTPEKRPLSN